MSSTKIEWADESWNPLRARSITGRVGWHCEKISPGCARCYAESFNGRLLPHGGTGHSYDKSSRSLVETYVDERVLLEPLRWRKPRDVFVCSMTDLFGEWVTDDQIARVFAVMSLAHQHTFKVLTKRAKRMRDYFGDRGSIERQRRLTEILCAGDDLPFPPMEERDGVYEIPLPNVWLGVSAENQPMADDRVEHLVATDAARRFISYEPALGPADFSKWLTLYNAALTNVGGKYDRDVHAAALALEEFKKPEAWAIHQIIFGGESGPKARPIRMKWAFDVADQCSKYGVALFMKQLGPRPLWNGCGKFSERFQKAVTTLDVGGEWEVHLKHPKGGNPAEWPPKLRRRESPRRRA